MNSTDRWTVVSADGHFGGPVDLYRPYMDAAYRDLVDDLAEEERVSCAGFGGYRAAQSVPGVYEVGPQVVDLGSDVAKRLAAQDEEGIAAEILLVQSDHAPPFFHIFNRPYPADVRAAGARAYHRWLADVISEADGRLLPVGYPGEMTDLAEALTEVEWVSEHGFVSVFAPGLVLDPNRPVLFDRYYDPFWAACTNLGLVVNMHAGWGLPQGALFRLLGVALDEKPGGPDADDPMALGENMKSNVMDANSQGSPLALGMRPRQLSWQLMLGGVFDRHPSLKVVLTEVRADWIPGTLAYLDARFAKDARHLQLKPSEYFARNCAVTPSTPHRAEVAIRHEIGIDQFLFGADIPHVESTWPNTREFLRDAFAGVPDPDVRKILGENAIRFFNLDRAHLNEIAGRIGPTADEVLAGAKVDERLVQSFHARSGYLKPVEETPIAVVGELLDADLAEVGAGPG